MTTFDLRLGDCRDLMHDLADASIDAIVTDPPYDLTSGKKGGTGPSTLNEKHLGGRSRIGTGGFMGAHWDATGVAFDPQTWVEILRVLKPGSYLLAFGGTRTVHRMACAIEDAGFEIRDRLRYECAADHRFAPFWESLNDEQRAALLELLNDMDPMGSELAWQFGSGFPKSTAFHRKMPDDLARAWAGWGSGLKPAYEPIIVARKPLGAPNLHTNVERFGVGGLNIDGCRVESFHPASGSADVGRWPANVLHDGSECVVSQYPHAPGQIAHAKIDDDQCKTQNVYGLMRRGRPKDSSLRGSNGSALGFTGLRRGDHGRASRFFYCAKASPTDRHEGVDCRGGNIHPTVKPVELMRWLVRLVCPPGGIVLDPFMGSGSTGKACMLEGMHFIGMEKMPEFFHIARQRIGWAARPSIDVLEKEKVSC